MGKLETTNVSIASVVGWARDERVGLPEIQKPFVRSRKRRTGCR